MRKQKLKNLKILTCAHITSRKEFRLRLQYFARGCQTYHNQLQVALKGKSSLELMETQVSAVCMCACFNVLVCVHEYMCMFLCMCLCCVCVCLLS